MDEVVHRLPVALLADIPLAKLERVFIGIADDAIAVRPDLNVPPIFLPRQPPHLVDVLARGLHVLALDMDEDHVAIAGGEMPSDAGAAGIHDNRKRMLD